MQLARREKTVVLSGVSGLALLMVVQFGVRPMMERLSTLRRVVTDKREVLTQLQARSQEYRRLETEIDRLRSRITRQQEGRRILSMVEGVRKTCGLPDDALSLKPATVQVSSEYQQTTVEIRLEGVTLAQLIDFLSQVDSLNLVGGVKALDIRTGERSTGLLKAVIQLVAVTNVESI